MSYSERKGDLFAATDLDALAHGVNCKGYMGAGIAAEFKRRYPDNFSSYQFHCEGRDLAPGGMTLWHALGTADGPWVFNLATQDRPGPDAKLRWVAQAVGNMLSAAEQTLSLHLSQQIRTIGMPRIGCGIGGLNWVEVRMIIELLANESEVEVVVFSL